ncbi:MAG: hypothetical protein U0934_07150 [Pseudotabrizicola sp.]|uniref:hypothetical protein n=1 Tax=Pseudotabrizicola sp. TaxID=2939647 RepID=UPI0027222110|nr:hypothetical protein [Pseudotabrizicola sp.]MDO8882306.1 hypothetical protein [Pseudotabrizicola sp.]MDP2080439.1 hypothetical protein [Pseudotabrizicola sp.]MDZ7573717.1 hypothetical protein [Pseudotabrizicola sp.]
MPKLIRLYIVNVAIGFAISAVFVAALVWLDVAGLQRLILGAPMGWVAALMLVMFNGVVFAGVQFAIAVMRMADTDDTPSGGTRARLPLVPVRVAATSRIRSDNRPDSRR